MKNKQIAFVKFKPRHREFLFRLFASNRVDITTAGQLTERQKSEMLQHQFQAQREHYERFFPKSEKQIIEFKKTPVGYFQLNSTSVEIHVIDLAILPEFQKMGIGSFVMSEILSKAKSSRLPVRLHVERMNHARRFYESLGFTKIGEKPLHLELQWLPPTRQEPSLE